MNEELKLIKIAFKYELIQNVDSVLKDIKILRRTFSSECIYLICVNTDILERVISNLFTVTYKQIKIQILENEDDEYIPGTDKPIGSKSAIDEN